MFTKQTGFTVPGPTQTFVFIDENPNTIDDGYFVCDPNQANHWVNAPATYHNKGGCLSFADGHSELKVWRDSKVQTTTANDFASDPNSSDLVWLQQRSTALK